MNWKRSLQVLATGLVLALPFAAHAQQVNMYWNTGGAGFGAWQPVSAANPLPISGSFTANLGGFHPTSSLTPITATTGGVTSASFTAGQSILVQNVGSTNAAYCFPGGSASTSSEYIPAGASAVITTVLETTITCATSASTTTINFQVGTGLWSGAGGGSGGGSGGNVTIVGPLGQSLAAASVPVVLTALQITALTPPTTVAVTQSTSPWIVAGGGTAGSPGTAVLTVQGILGGTAQPMDVVGSSSSTAAIPHASTTALGASLVAKASAGNLYGFNCSAIAGGAAGFCIAYNGTTAPSTGALTGTNVLDFCYFDTTARGCSFSRIPMAANYSTGIVLLVSSAASPYTYTTGTDTGAITVDYQ